MATLSEQTKLLNMCIGFAEGAPNWPAFFSDANYEIANILPTFRNAKAQRVSPGVIFKSHSYILVTECEPGTLSEELVEKLDNIDLSDIRNEFKSISKDNSSLKHQILYFGTESIDRDISRLDIKDPCLVFHTQEGRLAKRNNFDDSNLDSMVRETTVGNRIPTHFIPMTPEDHPGIIAEKVFQKLCAKAVRKESDGTDISAKEISKEVYGDYWELVSQSAKQETIMKVDDILGHFEDESADEDMKKLKQSGRRYFVRTSDAFRRKCQDIIDKLSDDDDGYQDNLSSYSD